MKAVQLEKPRSFRIIDTVEPAAPGPGEALVRIHRIGICGTDYSGYLGKMPFFSYPRIPGHELGIEVLAVGEGVAHVAAGQLVMGIVVPTGAHGGYREDIVLPGDSVVPVPVGADAVAISFPGFFDLLDTLAQR